MDKVKKPVKCTNAIKKKCKYSKIFRGYMQQRYCDYICMTGESRKCSANLCDKYEPK